MEELLLTNPVEKAELIATLKTRQYRKIMVSVSGKDSAAAYDLMVRHDPGEKVNGVYVNTGIEYGATKELIHALEEKYGRKIHIIQPKMTVPQAVKKYGQPFLSKQAAEYIHRLQLHDFQWEDLPFEELLEKYCKYDEEKESYIGCVSALEWWCNQKGDNSKFNISQNKMLKEFLMEYPPYFEINNKCCVKSKEEELDRFEEESDADLCVTGVRKAEGGARAGAYKNCFTAETEKKIAQYRPMFFFKKEHMDRYYAEHDIPLGKCYSQYGMTRSGCCCCPNGLNLFEELEIAKEHEPALYKLVSRIFRDSITYTRMYREFQEKGLVSEELRKEFQENKMRYFFEKALEECSYLYAKGELRCDPEKYQGQLEFFRENGKLNKEDLLKMELKKNKNYQLTLADMIE